MSPEAQRIAIAEACGWHGFYFSQSSSAIWAWFKDDGPILSAGINYPTTEIPNYLSDLNAMHEAEKILSDQQKSRYVKCIENGVPRPFGGSWSWEMLHATAAQRAEAFLRTLNLWTEYRRRT